jgi:hypothetical protein
MSKRNETDNHDDQQCNDRIAALAAIYQCERADASHGFNTGIEMARVSVVYAIAAILFMSNISHGSIPFVLLLLLPIPLWIIATFHSLMTLKTMSNGISVRIIEDALFKASGLPVGARDLVGSASGDKIMDITQAKAPHKLATITFYGTISSLVTGVTTCALYSAHVIVKNDGVLVHARVVEIAIVTYLLVAIMVALSWIVGIQMFNKGLAGIRGWPR